MLNLYLERPQLALFRWPWTSIAILLRLEIASYFKPCSGWSLLTEKTAIYDLPRYRFNVSRVRAGLQSCLKVFLIRRFRRLPLLLEMTARKLSGLIPRGLRRNSLLYQQIPQSSIFVKKNIRAQKGKITRLALPFTRRLSFRKHFRKHIRGSFPYYGCGLCSRNRSSHQVPNSTAGRRSHAGPGKSVAADSAQSGAGKLISWRQVNNNFKPKPCFLKMEVGFLVFDYSPVQSGMLISSDNHFI